MNICIIANGYPDKRDPQCGCFEKDQAIALTELGHKVSILYVDRRFRMYWRKIGITKLNGPNIIVYGIFLPPICWISKKITYRLHYKITTVMLDWLFRCYIKENEKPDVIYAHYIWNIAFSSVLKNRYNIPLIGIEHWSGLTQDRITPLADYWGKIAYSNADKLLAVSTSLQTHIRRHFGRESTVVYDMLGPEFDTYKKTNAEKNKAFSFIAVGNLLPIKGYRMLIQSFAISKLANEGCTLSIIGEGGERKPLEDEIRKWKLADSVILLGRKTKKEIVDYLSVSNVFVLSSEAETFGVACIEAMSQGLPAIVTRCGGPEEFIDESNGLLVEPHNPYAMATALRTMYMTYSNYDTFAIAKNCRSRFAPDVIAKKLTDQMGGVVSCL